MTAGKFVGKTLAQVQHLFDNLFEWGFTKLKQEGAKPREILTDDKYAGLKNIARQGADFLGTAGTEYYHEYERLKKEKRDKEQQKPS
jgi:phosphoglycolate phosphatase-like HAD superfamily hydrolase